MAKLRYDLMTLVLLLAVQSKCSAPESTGIMGDAGTSGQPDATASIPQPMGSAVTLAIQQGGDWPAGWYQGPNPGRAGSDPSTMVPWVAPADGELTDFTVEAPQAPLVDVKLTVSQAPDGVSYTATQAVLSLPTGKTQIIDTMNRLKLTRGDCLLLQSDKDWNPAGGLILTAIFVPAPMVPPTQP